MVGFLCLQDAKKGVLFIDFPPVLQLQLKRFEYDFMRDTMVKVCIRNCHSDAFLITIDHFIVGIQSDKMRCELCSSILPYFCPFDGVFIMLGPMWKVMHKLCHWEISGSATLQPLFYTFLSI